MMVQRRAVEVVNQYKYLDVIIYFPISEICFLNKTKTKKINKICKTLLTRINFDKSQGYRLYYGSRDKRLRYVLSKKLKYEDF